MVAITNNSSDLITKLCHATQDLDRLTVALQLPPLNGREWYDLLTRKLKPQSGDYPYLVVAVVGGTNIGKSVVFNHIAGARISATVPTASGTKHPTALINSGRKEQIQLESTFPGFDIVPWNGPEQPLQDNPQHLLFYRTNDQIPENLIIVDTPDVDSIAVVNWERAARVRQIADVLIVVLTQQKYNDLAIKEFFRAAADEGKLVIVLFNQCLLPEDENYWPLWMRTFCEATGVDPHLVYLAPYDRRSAESNTLPFYEREWPPTEQGNADDTPRNLMQDLSNLKFDSIKLRALSGAIRRVVNVHNGVPSWLKEIEHRAAEFADALTLLSSERLAEVDRWPTLPNSILIHHVRQWWSGQRVGWTASVHGVYRRVGQIIVAPIQLIRRQTSAPAESPLEIYRRQEWSAVLDVLERCFDRLERIRDIGNPLLKDRVNELLSGVSRAELIENLRREHQQIDFDKEVQELVEAELKNFREESPEYYRLFRRIDSMAAAARPMISLGLFVTGAGPVGEAIVPIATDAALRGVLHLAGDAVGGTVATVVGDKVLSETAAQGAGYLETRFRQLHTAFSQRRADWLSVRLNRDLLKGLPDEFIHASQIKTAPEFQTVRKLTDSLRESLNELE